MRHRYDNKSQKLFESLWLDVLYYSFVYPYFTYCNHIWGSTYKSNLRRLIVLQNKVLRIILHVKPRNSAEPFYKELNIMKFENIHIL